jgi:hypothetical protein
MIAWATASEQTFKTGEHLADKIAALTDEQIEIWLSTIEDPAAFLKKTEGVINQLKDQGARTPPEEEQTGIAPLKATPDPFTPDYPPNSGPYKDVIINGIAAFGIGGATYNDRCLAEDWADFIGVWWPLNKGFDALDGACVVAGCDPTGVTVCLPVCTILEVAKLALKVAAVPLELCDVHQGAIDGAEIEAGYENTITLIGLTTKIWEKQLEDNLLACDPVIGLILPEASGGQAEWVSAFVQDRINQYEAAGGSSTHVTKAQNRHNSGDAKFAAGNYGLAYEKYCAAYYELTKDLQF